VATDWVPAVTATIGAVSAIGGGVVGAWMQGRGQERRDRQRLRERAAEVIGTAFQLHVETAPDMLVCGRSEETATKVADELGRRHDAIRTQLWMLSVWYPSPRVRDLALNATDAMFGSLHASVQYAAQFFDSGGDADINEANRACRDAADLLGELLRAVGSSYQ
jgi:hypothetical protein